MFGIEMSFAFREDLIGAIVGYFKAWEFFLIRPKWGYLTSPRLYREHLKTVARVTRLSRTIMQQKQAEIEQVGLVYYVYHQSDLNPNTQLVPNKQLTLPAWLEKGPNFMYVSLPPSLFTSFYPQCSD